MHLNWHNITAAAATAVNIVLAAALLGYISDKNLLANLSLPTAALLWTTLIVIRYFQDRRTRHTTQPRQVERDHRMAMNAIFLGTAMFMYSLITISVGMITDQQGHATTGTTLGIIGRVTMTVALTMTAAITIWTSYRIATRKKSAG